MIDEDGKSRPARGGSPDTFIPAAQSTERTAEDEVALKIARTLIEGGVPVFLAKRCPEGCMIPDHARRGELHHIPREWQRTVPDVTVLNQWQPGDGLAAVGGSTADFLDCDPRSGGDLSLAEVKASGHMPIVFGVQTTPSGGTHMVISPLRERETNGFMPGLDYQGGLPNGDSRAFVWIAPTVRKSKDPTTYGQMMPYVWTQEPDMEWLAEFTDDGASEGLRARILARKAPKKDVEKYEGQPRQFTREHAEAWCQPYIEKLENAQVGDIEEKANLLAVTLYHFVPSHWPFETAWVIFKNALSKTAYDGRTWNADKFRSVIDGTRPPRDPWKATLIESSQVEVSQSPETIAEPKPSALEKLRASVLTLEQLESLPRAEPLIKGVLDMDSASWIIGQPGGFKSFVAIDWACHVATGREWNGNKVRKGSVFYVVAEGVRGFGKRVRAWSKVHNVRPESLFILPMPVQARGKDGKSLSDGWLALVQLVREMGPALIVLDTQARMTVGLQENDNTEMGVWVAAVDALKVATGACVLVVHHTGRNGGDARGASALDGAQDMEWRVDRKARKLAMRLSCDKSKDGDDSRKWDFDLEVVDVGTDEDGEPITSLVVGAARETRPDVLNTDSEGLKQLIADGRTVTAHDLVMTVLLNLTKPDESMTLTRAEVERIGNEGLKVSDSKREKFTTASYRTALAALVDGGQAHMTTHATPRYYIAELQDAAPC
jgi:hypothetical protein